MSINTEYAVLNVLPASVTQVIGGKWELSFNDGDTIKIEKQDDFDKFIKDRRKEWDQNKEFVLFVGASVTKDDWLVVGKRKVPERNLLNYVFKMEGIERHIFFFTDKYGHDGEAAQTPQYKNADPQLMKGVTLYRISCSVNPDMESMLDRIKKAAGLEDSSRKPKSAVEFYQELNGSATSTELRIAMVPSGKKRNLTDNWENEYFGDETDFAISLVLKREIDEVTKKDPQKEDLKNLEAICSKMKNTIFIDLMRLSFNKSLGIKKYVTESMENTVNCIIEMSRDKNKPITIGKIWLFVSGHGCEDGIKLSESVGIGIQELTEALFRAALKDVTKILVIDACRGERPPDPDDNAQADSECESPLGLLFRNEEKPELDDPWDVSGLKKCHTLFGSVPGFKTYDLDESILFKQMASAVMELKEAEEWHAFVQRIQCWIDKQDQQLAIRLKSNQGATSVEVSNATGNPTLLEPEIQKLGAVTLDGEAVILPEGNPTFEGCVSPEASELAADKIKEQRNQQQRSDEISQTHSVSRGINKETQYVVPK